MPWLGIASYGVAALLYGGAAVVLLVSLPRTRRATLLTAAVALSSLWAAGTAFLLLDGEVGAPLVALDAMRLFVWTACVLSWLDPPSSGRWLRRFAAAALVLIVLAAIFEQAAPTLTRSVNLLVVVMVLIGLLAVEQVFRNARDSQRAHLKWLCLAGGGLLTIDLFVYSQAALLNAFEPLSWAMRSVGSIALLPLIVLGAKRHAEWERELFVSRQVVFYTASLLGVGGYLLAMGLVAYAIRALEWEWGFWLEVLFFVAAVSVLLAILFSTTIRARFKVFLIKHFYRNKYDYREEWLRLTQSLGRTGDFQAVATNALQGLARIINSQHGSLWFRSERERYEWIVSLSGDAPAVTAYEQDHPLVSFLASTGWVVDSEEYRRHPDHYGALFGNPSDGMLPERTIVVPLDCQGQLQGFVMLAKQRDLASLNFEDHDILKTAGKQVAAVLAQALAQEKLAETRQFEAMNRLSTFLMHDLKNVVAQQELVLANAQRFGHRPEFVEDAFGTIRSGAERMKRVLEQLGNATRSELGTGCVDVSKILMEVRSQCADRAPIPQIELDASPAWVSMGREQLVSVLTHLVRNAQDATLADGRITISVKTEGRELHIVVEDTGSGMDAAFVRDRLFRPFDTTKGAKGMGIGAYQARHIVRSAGGDLDVVSEPGVGTKFMIRLPLAR